MPRASAYREVRFKPTAEQCEVVAASQDPTDYDHRRKEQERLLRQRVIY